MWEAVSACASTPDGIPSMRTVSKRVSPLQYSSTALGTSWACSIACDARPRGRGVGELDGHRPGHLGHRVQPEVALRDHAERAERAGEKFGEVVAGDVLDDLAAGLGHRPVREDHGDPMMRSLMVP
jgi:hypothetical protein